MNSKEEIDGDYIKLIKNMVELDQDALDYSKVVACHAINNPTGEEEEGREWMTKKHINAFIDGMNDMFEEFKKVFDVVFEVS